MMQVKKMEKKMNYRVDKSSYHDYDQLLNNISQRYIKGQSNAIQAVNENIIDTNWDIGRYIVEFEQNGNPRAKYGVNLLDNLSKDLSLLHGRGFSRSNLNYMRLFYLLFPICETLSHKLSWSHYCELVKIGDELERSFYYQQNQLENWSVRELKRQKESGLFLRLASSKDRDKVLKLARKGQIIEKPEDVIKDVYVFEFLKIPEPYIVSENELETRLIDNLQTFLLELGKGFTFVGRQYRIILNNTVYRVDLVFYHRILRCFVLIDLKINEVKHNDIGQMNMYMGYFDKEEKAEGDNPPMGIILSREKDELLVEYATYGMSSQLFISKYQLYLPNKEELKKLLNRQLEGLTSKQIGNTEKSAKPIQKKTKKSEP
jgi:predicted nuclease of restriction endonuclease-like (RecB) superfamily